MSTKYIHFTEQQKEQARQTDIADLLRRQGEVLKRSGKEWEWNHSSGKVTVCENLWFHQYEQQGGDAIDFVRRFYNKNFPEAMEYLLNGGPGTLVVSPPVQKKPPQPFVLPPKNDNMRRVYAYLINRRGIDRDVLSSFVNKGMIYESAKYHNAVFVGFDQKGVPRHAHMRGSGSQSTYKGNLESSLPEYSFHWHGQAVPAPNSHKQNQSNPCGESPRQSPSGKLFLFEAPIDMLSFISMHKDGWQKHSYAASCGVSEYVLWQMMKDNPNIKTVYLCRDNDAPGRLANKRTADALSLKGIPYEILVPIHKDWNEDRLAAGDDAPCRKNCGAFSISEEREVEEECQVLQCLLL